MYISMEQLEAMRGKHVYAMTRQGQHVEGILEKIEGGMIYLRKPESQNDQNKKAGTSAFFGGGFGFNPFIPLVLFDLLAIGTSPFGFGGFGGFGSPFFF